jgi:hypothetical protein
LYKRTSFLIGVRAQGEGEQANRFQLMVDEITRSRGQSVDRPNQVSPLPKLAFKGLRAKGFKMNLRLGSLPMVVANHAS